MPNETPTAPAARLQPSASYSFTMRLHAPQHGGAFARVAQAIADADAVLGAIDLVSVESREVVRDESIGLQTGVVPERRPMVALAAAAAVMAQPRAQRR